MAQLRSFQIILDIYLFCIIIFDYIYAINNLRISSVKETSFSRVILFHEENMDTVCMILIEVWGKWSILCCTTERFDLETTHMKQQMVMCFVGWLTKWFYFMISVSTFHKKSIYILIWIFVIDSLFLSSLSQWCL